MAARAPTHPNPASGIDSESLPSSWEPVEQDELSYSEYAAWEHAVTELRVSVRGERKPTRMDDPELSRDDTGYSAYVRGSVGARLTYPLASRARAFDRAGEFMRAHPQGEYSVPDPSRHPPTVPVEWEG